MNRKHHKFMLINLGIMVVLMLLGAAYIQQSTVISAEADDLRKDIPKLIETDTPQVGKRSSLVDTKTLITVQPDNMSGESDINNDDVEKIPHCDINDFINIEEINQTVASLKKFDGSSNQLESRIYALFGIESNDVIKRIDTLKEHLDRFPEDQSIKRRLLVECASQPDTSVCSPEEIQNLLTTLPDNSAYWLNAANYYSGIGDENSFKTSINNALQSNIYDETFVTEMMELISFLEASQPRSFSNIAAITIGFEAAGGWPMSNTVNFCIAQNLSIEMSELCLQLGKDMELRGKQVISKQLGIEIQKKIAQHNNQQSLVGYLTERSAAISDSSRQFQSNVFNHAIYDKELFILWKQSEQSIGEIESIETLKAEILRKLENPDYVPCPAGRG